MTDETNRFGGDASQVATAFKKLADAFLALGLAVEALAGDGDPVVADMNGRELRAAEIHLEGKDQVNVTTWTRPQPPPAREWPEAVGDAWVDAKGRTFDPELYSWSKANNRPSVTESGHFRKRRKPASANTTPPDAPAEPEAEPAASPAPDVDPEHYSPTLKAMLLNVNMAEDAAAVNRVENHPFAKELSDAENEVLVAACRARGAELTAAGGEG